jgi:hypothetical protein
LRTARARTAKEPWFEQALPHFSFCDSELSTADSHGLADLRSKTPSEEGLSETTNLCLTLLIALHNLSSSELLDTHCNPFLVTNELGFSLVDWCGSISMLILLLRRSRLLKFGIKRDNDAAAHPRDPEVGSTTAWSNLEANLFNWSPKSGFQNSLSKEKEKSFPWSVGRNEKKPSPSLFKAVIVTRCGGAPQQGGHASRGNRKPMDVQIQWRRKTNQSFRTPPVCTPIPRPDLF